MESHISFQQPGDDAMLQGQNFQQEPPEGQEPQTPETPPEGGSDEGSEGTDGMLGSFYELLREENLLSVPEDFEFDGTASGLRDATIAHTQMLERAAEQRVLSRIPESARRLVDYAMKGGADMREMVNLYADNQKEISLDTEADQESFLLDYYQSKGLGSRQVQRMVQLAKEEDTLESDAKEMYDVWKADRNQALQNQIAQQQQAHQAQVEEFKKFYSQTRDIMQEFQLNATKQRELHHIMYGNGTQEVAPIFQILDLIGEDPRAFVQLSDFVSYYKPGEGFDLESYKQITQRESAKARNTWGDKLRGGSSVPNTGSASSNKSGQKSLDISQFRLG